MAQASVSRQSIQEAIAALDAQPLDPNGDASLAEAIAVARDVLLLALARDPALDTQHMAVLVADLTGFTAIAERMDAEQVREAMNALWLELDGVIAAWGGAVAQHEGDSLVALFGRPARPSDSWRAVQAAQALQVQLASFNERARDAAKTASGVWFTQWPGPQMRIGIHEGLVTLAAGRGAAPATAGETVRSAYELEEAAPPGGILVSAPVRNRVRDAFLLQTPRPRRTAQPSALIGAPLSPAPEWQPGAVRDTVPHLVGRAEALDALEDAFHRARDARSLELVTVIGAAGAGKSRLMHALLPRLQLLSPDVAVLHAHLHAGTRAQPDALARDMLARYLAVYPSHGAPAIRRRIQAAGLPAHLSGDEQTTTDLAVHLLRPDHNQALDRRDAASLVRALLAAAAGDGPAVLVIDQLHEAGSDSLALLDDLLQSPPPTPVLVVGLAQPGLMEQPEAASISWLGDLVDPFLPATRVLLPPLSPVESRLIAADLLRPGAPVPLRLIDLIVADAGGNPWAIEEMVRHMIDHGLITPGTRWQFDLGRAETAALPRTLPDLILARLAQFPAPDQQVLGAAATAGAVFWDTAIVTLLSSVLAEAEVLAAISRLQAAGWVYADQHLSFGAAQGYYFARSLVQQVARGKVPAETRDRYLDSLARWRRDLPDAQSRAAPRFAAAGSTDLSGDNGQTTTGWSG